MRRLTTSAHWKRQVLIRNFLPYVLLFVFLALPLLSLFHNDFWDGSRIGYAQDANDFTRVRFWLFSASLEGQYFQEYSLNWVADLTRISPQLLGHSIVVVSLFILIREVTIGARDYLLIRKELIFIPGLIVAIFPSLSLTVSSILVYYISSLSLGWLCARKFAEKKGAIRAFAFIGIIYTFNYAVMILVCPVLVLFYLVNRRGEDTSKNFVSLIPFLSVVLAGVAFKTSVLILNPPEGPMLGYNRIKVPLNFTEISNMAYGIKSFSSFLLYPILILLPAWIWAYTRSQAAQICENERAKSNKNNKILIVLLLASVVPYLLVGKSTSLFWLDYWSGRHSFALIPALALFSVSILDWFLDQIPPISGRQLNVLSACISIVIISLSSLLLFRVLGHKYLEQQNRLGVIQSLGPVKERIQPGVATIYVKNSEYLELNPDESNYLMYKVKKNLDTFTLLTSSTSEPIFPGEIFSSSSKRSESWTLYSFPKKVCRTNIYISRISPEGKFLGIAVRPKYRVDQLETAC
jgi:hypothetical protein